MTIFIFILDLFTPGPISRHIKNVFDEGELHPEGTVAKSATVQTEGSKQVTREIEFYSLDVIISVGYRVKSVVATRFLIRERCLKVLVRKNSVVELLVKQGFCGFFLQSLFLFLIRFHGSGIGTECIRDSFDRWGLLG
jgi:hypothetical protein